MKIEQSAFAKRAKLVEKRMNQKNCSIRLKICSFKSPHPGKMSGSRERKLDHMSHIFPTLPWSIRVNIDRRLKPNFLRACWLKGQSFNHQVGNRARGGRGWGAAVVKKSQARQKNNPKPNLDVHAVRNIKKNVFLPKIGQKTFCTEIMTFVEMLYNYFYNYCC